MDFSRWYCSMARVRSRGRVFLGQSVQFKPLKTSIIRADQKRKATRIKLARATSSRNSRNHLLQTFF